MIITINYLSEKFDKYNNLYFKGELIKPKFEINNAKRALGCYVSNRYKSIREFSVIKISKYYERTEHDIDNTLIHEMIHLYQHQFNCSDRGHGVIFKRECRRINKFGWQLERVDHTTYEVSVENKNKKLDLNKEYEVCYYKEKNRDSYFIFVMSKNNVINFKNYFRRNNYEAKFFVSNNVKLFERMPKCRTNVRGKRLSKAQLFEYIK